MANIGEIEKYNCFVTPDRIDIIDRTMDGGQIITNNVVRVTISFPKEYKVNSFFITFPWGDKENCLTTNNYSSRIICSSLSDCSVNELKNQEFGKYWRVCSNGDNTCVLEFSKIVPFCKGITCIRIQPIEKMIDKISKKNIFYQLPIVKEKNNLEINMFAAQNFTVEKGEQVKLMWDVKGANKCIIDPGNFIVKSIGSKEIFVSKDTVFSLKAWDKSNVVSKSIQVYVNDKKN